MQGGYRFTANQQARDFTGFLTDVFRNKKKLKFFSFCYWHRQKTILYFIPGEQQSTPKIKKPTQKGNENER
jgi:hypothetical protein